MAAFNPFIHTPDALAAQIEVIQEAHPHSLLAGSLGRGAVHSAVLGDPTLEYRLRGQHPLRTWHGTAADIDVIGGPRTLAREATGPFAVDTVAFGGQQVRIVRASNTWVLTSPVHNFEEELAPEVMEPVSGHTVFDIPCRTVRPQTHMALLGISGVYRVQDKKSKKALQTAYDTGKITLLPDEMYAPFVVLGVLNHRRFINRARRVYQAGIPHRVRRQLAPVLTPFKERIM